MNRQNWTEQEDKLLHILVNRNGHDEWTKIAQLLRHGSSSANIKNRTGKQCRQRWYNHLDPNVSKSQWKDEEQAKLFEMHKVHGNKWKQLTKYLPGRTDNDIKNHFYSTLRRSLRRLNKYIGEKNSTTQMRQIKPSVLTFIINHIYNAQSLDHKQRVHRSLINSLKQLPQLIFKFSSFKPVKNNMNNKVDDTVRDRILIILNLVEQFKQIYNKEKSMEQNSESSKKKSNYKVRSKKEIKNVLSSNQKLKNQYQSQQNSQIDQENEQYIKQECNDQLDYNHDDILNPQKIWHENSSSKIHSKQFTPIVTIQRKVSTVQKASSKKLIMIPKIQQKIENFKIEEDHNNTKIPFHFLDERIDNQLMSLEQPSISMQYNENSNFFHDLIVIGKHIVPLECGATNDVQNECQIDEILYQNYQN